MPKTSGNVLTLLMTGPPSSLSAANITSSSCLPKKEYYSSLVSSASDNPKRLWQTVNKPSTANPPHRFPPLVLALHLQTALLLFFAFFLLLLTGKISKLRLSLTSNPATSSPHSHLCVI